MDAPGGAGADADTPTAAEAADSVGDDGGTVSSGDDVNDVRADRLFGGDGSTRQQIVETARDLSNRAVGGDGGGGQQSGSAPSGPPGTDELNGDMIFGGDEQRDVSYGERGGAGLTEQEASAVIGSFAVNNPGLVDTGAGDGTGRYNIDDLGVRRTADGGLAVVARGTGGGAAPTRRFGTTGTPGLAAQGVVDDTARANQSRSFGTTGTPRLAAGPRSRQLQNDRQRIQARVDSLVNAETEAGRRYQAALTREYQEENIGTVQDRVQDQLRQQQAQTQGELYDFDWSAGLGDGATDEVEQFVDDTTSNIGDWFRGKGQSLEEAANRRAARSANSGVTSASTGPAATLRIGGEFAGAAGSVAGELAELPAVGLEAVEGAGYLVGGLPVAGGSRPETFRRLGVGADYAKRAAGQTIRNAKRNPRNFAAETFVSAGLGAASQAGKLSRVTPDADTSIRRSATGSARTYRDAVGSIDIDSGDVWSQIRDEFTGVSRGQGNIAPRGGNDVKTASDIFDTDEEIDEAVSSDQVETDGQQLMLTKQVQKQTDAEAEGQTAETASEAQAYQDMQLDVEELKSEFADQSTTTTTATEAASADGVATTTTATAAAMKEGKQTQKTAEATQDVVGGVTVGMQATDTMQGLETLLGRQETMADTTQALKTRLRTQQRTAQRLRMKTRTKAETRTKTKTKQRLREEQQTESELAVKTRDQSQRRRQQEQEKSRTGEQLIDESPGSRKKDGLLDGVLGAGFVAETFTAIATKSGTAGRAASQETLEAAPRAAKLTGELPTAAAASGSAETQAAFNRVADTLTPGSGGAAGFDLGVNDDGGNGGDSSDAFSLDVGFGGDG
ncbi:hypothetical protein [Halobaculum sp. D14]|uniref:hypothetical protein n=1 Tax=Halobaculum sp. D14 TaxID=3421642 RepID=UPI003EBE91F7